MKVEVEITCKVAEAQLSELFVV